MRTLRFRLRRGDFGVADCYVTGVVLGYLDGPLGGYAGCSGFEVGLDFFKGVEVVAWFQLAGAVEYQ